MKLIRLAIYVLFVHFYFMNSVFAGTITGTPTKYETTMTKFELCTSSACTTTTVLGEKTATFDIASASAGADVGDWISSFALEVGTTYTHVQATINVTFTIAGYITDDDSNGLTADYCVTSASPSTAASASTPAIVPESSSTSNADMSWVVPNMTGTDYGDLTTSFGTNGITKTDDASTITWIGALTSSYTPTASSAPKFTMSFDVTNMLQAYGTEVSSGVYDCAIYVKPPAVSISISD
ncbi:uncharacterized protein METZ01_LOCUS95009 [marine metagenome]|uniref:Uncharacterized protein n=1 Tax=marine metagenome TaxID=408172 RepID=A0A381VP98_9ZZZZ